MRYGHVNFNENVEQLIGAQAQELLTPEQYAKKKESYQISAYSIVGLRNLFDHRDALKAGGASKSELRKVSLGS